MINSTTWSFRSSENSLVVPVKLTRFSYRFADEVLSSSAFKGERKDIEDIFGSIAVPQLHPPKLRAGPERLRPLPLRQK
jgi:hypothetical protein